MRAAPRTVRGLLALGLLPAAGVTAQPAPPPPVGVIEIVGHEVFDESADRFTAPYRVANRLHVRTRDEVVRRELLFETGEPLDRELVEQTERNLRGLPFLRDARIETVEVDADRDGRPERVDIRVTTWDTWSLAPRFDLEQVEDRTIWEAGFSEKNLLGFGKSVTVSHRTNLDRTTDRVVYADPQLVGSNVGLTLSVANLSDGDEQFLTLDRDYLSLRDPWAFSVRAGSFKRTDPLFTNGVEVGRLPHRGHWGDLEAGRALRRGDTDAIRLFGAYRLREERVGGEGRDFGIVETGVRAVSHRFVRLTHVNAFERNEDFNLGRDTFGTVGLSTPALGGAEGRVLFVSAGHAEGVPFGDRHFLLAESRFAGRRERGVWRNAQTLVRARYLLKHAPRQALVGRVQYIHGHNLDPEVQLLLGAETGLRGYPVRQFSGTRSLLLSAEERWFVADDVGQLFSVGLAAFVDSGFAWPDDRAVALADLKTAVGVSVLLGSHRLSTRGGVRLDIGYGLVPIAGVGRWVFAAGSDIDF